MKMHQARGFTLIELMVVMSIIALLLTIAVIIARSGSRSDTTRTRPMKTVAPS